MQDKCSANGERNDQRLADSYQGFVKLKMFRHYDYRLEYSCYRTCSLARSISDL